MINDSSTREKHKRNFLHNNGRQKECGICHKIKPYSEFYSKNEGLRNICRECNKIVVAKESFIHKFLIFANIYNGIFNEKCSNCDIDVAYLPAIDFHHSKRDLKQVTWRDNRFKNWKKMMLTFEEERVIPLCKNCHALENAKNFQDYKELILNKDIFKHTAEEIHQIVSNYVKLRINNYVKNFKFRVIEWLKKRFIIEQLYDGKCQGCQKINVFNNLPALGFHHIFKTDAIDKLRWRKIKKYGVNKIARLLIEEKCICLCSNCHTLIHATQFSNVIDEILDHNYVIKYKSLLKEILSNIDRFKLLRTDIEDPLRILFKQGEIWKKYILHIHFITINENVKEIKSKELLKNLYISNRHLNRVITNLSKMGLIEIVHKSENSVLKLTPNAYNSINKMIKDKRYNHYIEKNLKSML